jgi:hypothetical protein
VKLDRVSTRWKRCTEPSINQKQDQSEVDFELRYCRAPQMPRVKTLGKYMRESASHSPPRGPLSR